MNGRQDVIWLDWAKIIGMFLVIYGHLLQITGTWPFEEIHDLWNIIYLFHMPLFFLLSGYVYRKGYSLKTVFWTLIVPYTIYQLFYLPIPLSVSIRDNGVCAKVFVKHLLGFILGDGYSTPIAWHSCPPCWFIVCIIQLRVLFKCIDITSARILLLIFLCPIILSLLKVSNIDLYGCVDCTIMATPFFLIGFWMGKENAVNKIPIIWGGILSVLSAIGLLFIYKINGPSQMNGPSYSNSIVLTYLAGYLGSYIVIYISILLEMKYKPNKILARNTLFLIFYHWIVLFILYRVGFFNLWMAINSYYWYASIMVFYALLVLLSSIPLIKFLNESYPLILGKIRK